MTRTANLGFTHDGFYFSPELRAAWPWIWALDAFDYGDPSMLANLIATSTVPAELRGQIARIVSGERKPNKRAAAKLKMHPRDRMEVAAAVSVLIGLYDKLKFDLAGDESGERKPLLEIGADRARSEQIERKRILEDRSREVLAERAIAHGVSVETIENLVRLLRKKLLGYPNV